MDQSFDPYSTNPKKPNGKPVVSDDSSVYVAPSIYIQEPPYNEEQVSREEKNPFVPDVYLLDRADVANAMKHRLEVAKAYQDDFKSPVRDQAFEDPQRFEAFPFPGHIDNMRGPLLANRLDIEEPAVENGIPRQGFYPHDLNARCFFFWESFVNFGKLLLHISVIVACSFSIAFIKGNSRPIEDLWRASSKLPITDLKAFTLDTVMQNCPDGYKPYTSMGYDQYTRGKKKNKHTFEEHFYGWKNIRFCARYLPGGSQLERASVSDGKCPTDEILCNGLCFPGPVCPITSVSLTQAPGPVPIEEGTTWYHRGKYQVLSFERAVPDEAEALQTPILSFSITLVANNPPVKCLGEPENGRLKHGYCHRPDPQYTLIDQYTYDMENNALFFYQDNKAQAIHHLENVSTENVGLFTRHEQVFLSTTCPVSLRDITGLKYHTTIIYNVSITLVVVVVLEFFIFLFYFPRAIRQAFAYLPDPDVRKVFSKQIINTLGATLALVLLIYSLLIFQGIAPVLKGTCFESEFTKTFSIYEDEILVIIWLSGCVFMFKLAMICYDFLYCCVWKP